MKKKKVVKAAKKGGHLKHMGHVTDDLTMIIIAGGAFLVMVAVVVITGQMVVTHGSPVTQVNAESNAR